MLLLLLVHYFVHFAFILQSVPVIVVYFGTLPGQIHMTELSGLTT